LHRPSNVDNPDILKNLIGGMTEIFPIHPRTQANLDKFGITLPESIVTIKPQAYIAFLDLLKDAQLVLTDSGGIQEETTALGIPCLTLRENTERPITAEEGTNVVAGTDPVRIVAEAEKVLSGQGKRGRLPELWHGRAAERIVQNLAHWMQ